MFRWSEKTVNPDDSLDVRCKLGICDTSLRLMSVVSNGQTQFTTTQFGQMPLIWINYAQHAAAISTSKVSIEDVQITASLRNII